MNAVATLSNALSRQTLPKNVLLQYNRSSSTALSRGWSFSSSGAAASIISSSSASSVHTNHHLHLPLQSSLIQRHQPQLTIFPTSTSQQRRSLFIQTATTPNPESLKFVPNGRLVLGHNSEDGVDDPASGDDNSDEIETASESNTGNTNGVHLTRKDHTLIARSPLAKTLFNLDLGIKSIYLGYDFLTVTKYAEAHWSHLQTPIFGAIMDFYATGEPTMRDAPQITDTTILDDDDEVVAMIKELLETRIRPAVQEDGGDIRYVGFDDDTGIVTVQLAGSCVGCPSSSVTLKNGVENMLMHYIPEVTNVVSLEEEEEDEEGGYDGTGGGGGDDVVVEQSGGEDKKKMKTYQDKLAAAGIPFSD